MSAAYPPTKPRTYDRQLARTLALIQAIERRLSDPYTPRHSSGDHPGWDQLGAFRKAARADQLRAQQCQYIPSDADFLQALYAIGTHCVFHGTEFVDLDPDRRTCLPCEFETADRRYQGHAVIPYLPGELVNA